MKLNTGVADKQREGLAKLLGTLLSDQLLLYVKTRHFHWKVVGSDFGELHKFCQAQCAALDDIGTNDFLTGLLETHEKMAWMLRSHLR